MRILAAVSNPAHVVALSPISVAFWCIASTDSRDGVRELADLGTEGSTGVR
jgi:hypothetical protein